MYKTEDVRPGEASSKPDGVLSDHNVIEDLISFLAAPKPQDCSPIEVLHAVHLIVRRAHDHAIYDSRLTLASAFACDPKTVSRSQVQLVKLGWLSKPRRRGKSSGLMLRYDNLPESTPTYLRITPEAKQLASRYQLAIVKHFGRRKFPKGWLAAQFPSAQKIINLCGGDFALALHMVGLALGRPEHRKRSQMSLYHLLTRWTKIKATYEAALAAHTAQQQQQQQQEREAA